MHLPKESHNFKELMDSLKLTHRLELVIPILYSSQSQSQKHIQENFKVT